MNPLFDKGAGPVISVVVHVGIVVFLLKVLVFRAPEESRSIDVQVVENQVRELEPVERELESVESVDAEDALDVPDDLVSELPSEDLLPDSMLESKLDLSGLDSVAQIESPLVMTGLMAGRSDSGRKKLLREFGGL